MLKRNLKRLMGGLFFERNESFWYRRDLSTALPVRNPGLPIEISLDNAEETLEWLKGFDEPWMYNVNEIKVGLEQGHCLANAKLGADIIAYSKVGARRVFISDFNMAIDVPEKVAVLYHIYVLPEYRKSLIAKDLLSELLRAHEKRGFSSMCCQIAKWNEPSIRLFTGSGFERIADVKFYRFFGHFRFWRIKRNWDAGFSLTSRFSLHDLLETGLKP
jgi:ribosomal protein S18 acetylase RimI-like enzyme